MFVDVEAVAEDWHLQKEVFVVERVEVGLGVQVSVVTVSIAQEVLSQISKSWQVTHWNRMPQIG